MDDPPMSERMAPKCGILSATKATMTHTTDRSTALCHPKSATVEATLLYHFIAAVKCFILFYLFIFYTVNEENYFTAAVKY